MTVITWKLEQRIIMHYFEFTRNYEIKNLIILLEHWTNLKVRHLVNVPVPIHLKIRPICRRSCSVDIHSL